MATANVNTVGRWDPQSVRAAPELMTARELEAMLKIDVKTIYSYVLSGHPKPAIDGHLKTGQRRHSPGH